MSFAMEHMKDSHLWWFYVFFFCTKLWILPSESLPEFLCDYVPKIWFGFIWQLQHQL
jgi:hypothetical protein